LDDKSPQIKNCRFQNIFLLTVGFISKVALRKPNKGKTIEKNLHRSTVTTSGIENKTNGNNVECAVEASYCDY
jgi:hypothetical protein